MGVVYLAEQLDVGGGKLRDVALKTITPTESTSADLAHQISQRFLREVRIAARLASPNVVTVYDFGKLDDGELYFTMEVITGETLRDVLRREGPLSPRRAATIAGQICDALSEAHAGHEPIVHRDLKPANIFVQRRYTEEWVKVADFGIAKILGSDTGGLTATGSSPGTPIYMSPEQWRADAKIDGRSDLYALGVILFEMLSGAPPFSGEPHALMYRHLNEAPPPLPASVPEGLRGVISLLLAKAPADRFSNARAVRRALENALAGPAAGKPGATATYANADNSSGVRAVSASSDAVAHSAQRVAGPSRLGRTTPDPTRTQELSRNGGRPIPEFIIGTLLAAVVVGLAATAFLILRSRPTAESPPIEIAARAPSETTTALVPQVPNAAPVSRPFESLPPIEEPEARIATSRDGFDFQASACGRSGGQLSCSILITNRNRKAVKLTLYAEGQWGGGFSYLSSDSGEQIRAVGIRLGAEHSPGMLGQNWLRQPIEPELPMKASIELGNVTGDTRSGSLVIVYDVDGRPGKVMLRNIPIREQ